MLNIVIPMAGAGSRFAQAGYKDPKPLIPIHGVPMIRLVIQNLTPKINHRFIFICQSAHVKEFNLDRKFSEWAPNSQLIQLDGITEGAACTVLKAAKWIDNGDALMIANSDQYVDVGIDDYLSQISTNKLQGLIMTMTASDPKWSFVGLNDEKLVSKVVEKEVISHEATVGIYNFLSGKDYVRAANQMIERNLGVNNEFYVAPVYNQLIEEGARIGMYNVGSEGHGMYGLGIPADLNLFLDNPVSKKAAIGIV